MQLPREVIVGNGIIDKVVEVSNRLGYKKSALIVTGITTHDTAGKTVKGYLEEEGVKVDTLIVKSAGIKDVVTVENQIKELRPQVVLGVGGGTRIDVAKLSSAHQKTPFISVPTTASHDGIASPLSSLKGSEKPHSVMAQAPIAILADTGIIMQAPWRCAVSGCGDVISKFTSVKDWRLAHKERGEYYGEYAASLALMSAKLVMKNADIIMAQREKGLRILLEALISCGVAMSIAGSSHPCSGSEHMFSHALDMIEPNHAMHGEQCGVGAIMMAYLHKLDWRKIKETLERLNAPTDAKDLGVREENIVKALEISPTVRPERYTILNKLELSHEDYNNLVKMTNII
ncbi:MAG: NAD(P)-dependent glycerol-1-phosphate dehydrogenase [Candidatus Bathyarchaeota archaeon]|jgi:glycerol-1-phosphate dehydrogenase [NAD(P)+]